MPPTATMPVARTVYMIYYTSGQPYIFSHSKFKGNYAGRGRWKEDVKQTSSKLIKGNVSVRSRSIFQRAENFTSAKVDKHSKLKSMKTEAEGEQIYKYFYRKRWRCNISVVLKNETVLNICQKQSYLIWYMPAVNMYSPHRVSNENKSAGKHFYYQFVSTHHQTCLQNAESTSLRTEAAFSSDGHSAACGVKTAEYVVTGIHIPPISSDHHRANTCKKYHHFLMAGIKKQFYVKLKCLSQVLSGTCWRRNKHAKSKTVKQLNEHTQPINEYDVKGNYVSKGKPRLRRKTKHCIICGQLFAEERIQCL
jgi:hypothetical protein